MATKHKEISPKNQIISLLENGDYIKNPLVYSQLRGNMSLIQTNVYMAVVNAMQDRINSAVAKHKAGDLWGPTDLFSQQEQEQKLFSFTIPLASLNLSAKDYSIVEDMCRKMVERSFTYKHRDDDGNWKTEINSVFTKIAIPTSISANGNERRVGNIVVEMKTEVAEHLFSLRSGYVTHLADIVPKCKNAKTPRLYIYLCSLNDNDFHHGVGEIGYIDLKEYLGVLTYTSQKRDKFEDKYKMYSYFRRDVLDPIKKEMDDLRKRGEVEFTFEYEPIYLNGKKRGNPDKIKFSIFPPTEDATIVEEELSGTAKAMNTLEQESPKRQFLFTSRKDLELFRKLLAMGNEWAKAHETSPYDVDDFEAELRKNNLI